MERLTEQQAIIECLINTAKYYKQEDADECIDFLKKQYKQCVKADMISMLKEIQLDIESQKFDTHMDKDVWNDAIRVCSELIQQKINELKGDKNEV